MSVRSRLANRAGPYLEPGEQIQAVFPAVSGPSPYTWPGTGNFTAFSSKSHEVVVTEGRVRGIKTDVAPSIEQANALFTARRPDPGELVALARTISDWKQEITDGPARHQKRR